MLQVRAIILVLCLLACAFARAQDPDLPKGKGQVIFLSGKIMEDIVLWKLYPKTLEYLKDENLHDLPLEGISYFHYPHADYELNDSNKLVRVDYDELILIDGDTIFCFIREINPLSYIYTLPGKTVCQSIPRYNVRKHILAGLEEVPYTPGQKVNVPATPAEKIEAKPDSASKGHGTFHQETSPVNYYARGKADGNREFRGNGSLTGGLLLGFIPVVGWLAAPVTLAVSPTTTPLNATLYKTNKQYRQGYEKGAWNKKARRTLTGVFAGVVLFFSLTLH